MPRAFALLTALLLLCAGGASLRFAAASYLARTQTPSDLRRAIRLTPANPNLYAALAEADPAVALPAIQNALAVDPLNSTWWIRYSRIAESKGNDAAAERALRQAARLDDGFAPRWLLSDFYFRHNDPAHFWPAVKQALAVSYDDITPLLRQCRQLAPNGEIPLSALPPRAAVLRQFLDYLLNEAKRPDLAAPVAASLVSYRDPDSVASLLDFCGRAVESGHPSEAIRVWNDLASARLIHQSSVSPACPLANNNLHQPFLGAAFDWRLNPVLGVQASDKDTPGLSLTFSGSQPEHCELLTNWVALNPNTKYRLQSDYETSNLESATGISWKLWTPLGGHDILPAADRVPAPSPSKLRPVLPPADLL